MPVKIAIAQIQLSEGQRVTLENINWQEFEDILEDLGEHRHSLMAYYKGVLELKMPLPGHERIKVIIGDLIKILLDELGLEWESLGSTTFKSKHMQAGIEPDDCFYIKNYQAMIGKMRLDLDVDLVPDLAIEVDFTSITKTSAYEALGVPEIWRYENGKLEISLFVDGKYINSDVSKALPTVDAIAGVSLFLEKSKDLPTSALRREFRQWLQSKF